MSDLFNVSGWDSTIGYSEFDAVSFTITGRPYYFYSKINNNTNNHPTGNNNSWTQWPILTWPPSYTTNASLQFNTIENNFGDGYVKRVTNFLDTRKLDFNITYQNINEKQTKAICHAICEANGETVLGFNPSGIFTTGNGFLINNVNVNFISYNNYNVDFVARKVYELGNYCASVEPNPVTQSSVVYFNSGSSFEAGVYKIKYYNGVNRYWLGGLVFTWMPSGDGLTIHYGSNSLIFTGIGGGGPDTNDGWSTQELAAKHLKKQKPEINIVHTGGTIGIEDNAASTASSKGQPPLTFYLYKIK